MGRKILVLCSALAALSVWAIGSASSASAAECAATPATPDFCFESGGVLKEFAAPESAEGNLEASVLKGKITGVNTTIECKEGKLGPGKIADGGKSEGTIKYQNCKLLAPANCKLTNAQETEIKTGELVDQLLIKAGRLEDKFTPKATAFATIEIEGINTKCVPAKEKEVKKFEVTGAQTCEADANNAAAEAMVANHTVTCLTTGSELKLGGNAATYEGKAKEIHLTGANANKPWGIRET